MPATTALQYSTQTNRILLLKAATKRSAITAFLTLLQNLLVSRMRQKQLCNFSFVILKIKEKTIAVGIYFPLRGLSLSLPLWVFATMNFTILSSSLALQAKFFNSYSDKNKDTTSLPQGDDSLAF